MKKPYVKKIGKFSGYDVYYVNGYWIRRELEKSFPNYGSNNLFRFIPKNEFWIDYENSAKEAKYIIINFIAFTKAREQGKSYAEAIKICTEVENRERRKLKWVKKLRQIKLKEKILKKIHKRRILSKYSKNLKIWIIKGEVVRALFNVDFNQGGHHKVYHFIPENEVWIDDSIYYKEIPFVLIHELHERRLMIKGWKYDSVGLTITNRKKNDFKKYAHPAAEDLEFWVRKHPKSIKKVLLKEVRENDALTRH